MSGFSAENIPYVIVTLCAFIMSVAVHEFGHAFVADRLGDRLPRSQGRVTLNPIAHIDPIGTLLMPLLQFVFPGAPLLAWGKPVQTNTTAYTRKLRRKTGHMLVAAAGPIMNLLMAVVVSAAYFTYLKVRGPDANPQLEKSIILLIALNLSLLFFNLLPLPPLDGGTVLAGVLPDSAGQFLEPLERYGGVILLALLATRALNVIMAPAMLLIAGWVHTVQGWAL